jgi:hypothetical protein
MAHFVDFNSLKQKDESSATEVKEIKIVIADDASENLCQVLNEHKTSRKKQYHKSGKLVNGEYMNI